MIMVKLDYVPPSLNKTSNWHWARKSKEKKKVEEDIYMLTRDLNLEKPIRYAKIKITYFFPDKRRRDVIDNYNPKWICDGIVKAGIIEDDRYQYVGVPELAADYSKNNAHTIIQIWEANEYAKENSYEQE